MQKIKHFTFALLFGIAAVGLTTVPARATAILNVAGGQLIGARNVNVNGSFFDVTFADGTCVALFAGCDQNTDFAFNDSTSAVAAAQALLDHVFLDTALGSFDTNPELTLGCAALDFCLALIPYGLSAARVGVIYPFNSAPPFSDGIESANFLVTVDMSSEPSINYAIFTPASAVPEPSTLLLFAVGLIGLAGIGWRRRRHAAAM